MKPVIEQNGIVWRLLSENDPPRGEYVLVSIPDIESGAPQIAKITGNMINVIRFCYVRIVDLHPSTYFAELPQLNREEI